MRSSSSCYYKRTHSMVEGTFSLRYCMAWHLPITSSSTSSMARPKPTPADQVHDMFNDTSTSSIPCHLMGAFDSFLNLSRFPACNRVSQFHSSCNISIMSSTHIVAAKKLRQNHPHSFDQKNQKPILAHSVESI